jgi:hypothetical protein
MLLFLPVIKTLDKDIGYVTLKRPCTDLNNQVDNGIHIFLISLKIMVLKITGIKYEINKIIYKIK